jgi:hypothetical protein
MIFEKALVINRIRISALVKFSALLAVVIFAPLFHNQIITGSLVNAALFIAVITLGLREAILISILPSLFALTTGTLPVILAPITPFIMLSNVLLVLVFNSLKNVNYWWKIFSAALIKFIFLFAAASWAINILFHKELPAALLTIFSWPQLLTALIGGVLAYLVTRNIKPITSN